jgi:hypothetical protein
MARISTYNLDEKVSGGDKWIGSDSDFYNRTKNFTPLRLAEFFNSSESVNSSNSLRFWYQTLEHLEDREFGTFSFETEIGASIPFSSISSILVSKKTEGNIYVSDFLESISNSKILIHRGSSINEYGLYLLTDVVESITEPDFLEFTITFIQGNGNLLEDKGYLLSVIDFDVVNSNDKNYIHNQTIPAAQWSVQHNLNKYPSASVMLPSGHIGIADITHIDQNNLTITFAGDETGKAIIN